MQLCRILIATKLQLKYKTFNYPGGFMKKILLVLSSLFMSVNAFAYTEYVGTIKGSNTPCVLEIEQIYFENNIEAPENFRADIAVSLEASDDNHINDKHGNEFHFTVKPSGKPQILSGLGSNQQDSVNVLTSVGSTGLQAPVAFAIKWLHGNHFHTAQCLNLKLVDHE